MVASPYLLKKLQEEESGLLDRLAACRRDMAVAAGDDIGRSMVETAEKAIKEIPPLRWLIPGLIHSVGFGICGSAPFVGKTFMCASLAGSVSAGRPVFGNFKPTAPAKVAYLYGESNRAEFLWGIKRSLESRGIDGKNLFVKADRIPASQMKIGMPSLEAIVQSTGCKLLILDTLAFFNQGTESNDDLQQRVVEPLVELVERNQIFCLLVTHAQKATAGVEGIYQIRGGTTFTGAADVVLRMERVKGAERDSHQRTLIAEKVRGAPSWETTIEMDFTRRIVYEQSQDPREILFTPEKLEAMKSKDPWKGDR